MRSPALSEHFQARTPSAIRTAQIEFMQRADNTQAINTAIGNVSLPMHPAMQERMHNLGAPHSPFSDGVVAYSATVGERETQQAVLNILSSSDLPSEDLQVLITDGGSAAMELVVVGLCGPAGTQTKPLLLIDAAYTNYIAMAARTGRCTISVGRHLEEDGQFSLPDMQLIEKRIKQDQPAALLVIPYDNPTGQYYNHTALVQLAQLCVKYNLWMVSDEAYRELFYLPGRPSSIWRLSEEEVPGIRGRRISIETASKVWNACGLRTGALVTDNPAFHVKAVAEYTANLCSNVIGQYIFGALASQSAAALKQWYQEQRDYYYRLMREVVSGLEEKVPGLIVSRPQASIYSVVDVRNICRPGFDAQDFVLYCAREGAVDIDGTRYTLLVSPMAGFYDSGDGPNPGLTQMRISYVDTPERMALVPQLFATLLFRFEKNR